MKYLKHPATVIAAVALFVAMGGGAVAYASGLINGSQIKNHSIATKKLTKKAIKQLKGNRGPAGPAGSQGVQGVQGVQGIQGPIGPSNAYSTFTNDSGTLGSGVAYGTTDTVITSLALGAGSYVIMVNTNVYDPTAANQTTCYLRNQADLSHFLDDNYVNDTLGNNYGYPMSLLGVLTTTGSTHVQADCIGTDAGGLAYDTRIAAIKVGSVTGTLSHFNGMAAPRTFGK